MKVNPVLLRANRPRLVGNLCQDDALGHNYVANSAQLAATFSNCAYYVTSSVFHMLTPLIANNYDVFHITIYKYINYIKMSLL